ncbi:MAG TPA: hypothetical protein VNS08_08855 [Ureibacillus sp.]|nr:hypothetical protein [Ureibacillus sp.]
MKRLSLFLSLFIFVFLVGCSDSDSKKQNQTEEPIETEEVNTTDKKSEVDSVTNIKPSNSETDLAEDFASYIDEIVLLAPEEDRIINLYDSVTGLNYTNDEELYYTLLDEVVPSYRQFIIELEAITPQNPRIRELHEVYIEAANIQYNSFTLILSAIEKQDMDTMTEANQGLDQARSLLRDWLYEVDAISNETGVSL